MWIWEDITTRRELLVHIIWIRKVLGASEDIDYIAFISSDTVCYTNLLFNDHRLCPRQVFRNNGLFNVDVIWENVRESTWSCIA